MFKEFGEIPGGAKDFESEKNSEIDSQRAEEVARILEGVANPSNPRYENLTLGPISDVIVRAKRGEQLEMPRTVFEAGTDAAEAYLAAARDEKSAGERKRNAADYLIGIARRIPNFRGIGFPEENSSATIVEKKNKKVLKENGPRLAEEAGVDFHEIGTEQVELRVNVPVTLTDRKGARLTPEEMENRLNRYFARMLRPEDKGLVKIERAVKIFNWKKLAQLIREGKVSHELVEASEDLEVRPIALSQIPPEKTTSEEE